MNPTSHGQRTATCATLLVDELVTALVNSRIYELEHPRLRGSLARVVELAGELADATSNDRLQIVCFEGMVFFEGKPLLGASIAAGRLIDAVAQWQAGGLELARQVTADELAVFFACLLERKRHPDAGHAQLNARVASRRCIHVELLPPTSANAESTAADEDTDAEASVLRDYQGLIHLLQDVTVAVCRGGTIDFGPVSAGAERILEHLEHRNRAVVGLLRHEQYDAFTFGHSIRVAILAMNFARTLTDDREVVIRVGAAALLHDVGKSLIPFEILHSPTTLSPEEREVMSRHSELGARCLLDHHDSDPLAIAAAFGHHMTEDGTGYPNPVHDHPISWIVALVKICDIFEALTAARPYKNPMSPVRAYRVMLAMGDKLDRKLLRRFVDIHGIYPVGQRVQLANGGVAEVWQQTGDLERPIVRVIEACGQGLGEEEELLDLRDVACSGVRAILGELGTEHTSRLANEG